MTVSSKDKAEKLSGVGNISRDVEVKTKSTDAPDIDDERHLGPAPKDPGCGIHSTDFFII